MTFYNLYLNLSTSAFKTERFINITSNNSTICSIFNKNIKIINNGSKIHRQGEADKAGAADSAAGGKEGPEDRRQVRGLLVRVQRHPDSGQGFG